jgi:hypothetical protein
MKNRLTLFLLVVYGLALPACQTAQVISPAAVPVASSAKASTYLSPEQTQKLKDMLPGPFPRREGSSVDESKALDALLTAAEVEVIRGVQADSSAQARARADHLEELDPWWNFDFAMGPHFNSRECPKIDAFMGNAEREVAQIKDAAKKKFARPRPPESGLTSNDSYPSGHSTRAFFRARILSEIAPEKKDQIEMEARSMVNNRMIAGKHHPADCVGGIVLGTAIAEAMIGAAKDPSSPVHADFEAAKQEWKDLLSKPETRPKGKPGA